MSTPLTPRRSDQKRYLNLDDYSAAAQRLLPRALFAYVSGSAGDGETLAANRDAFKQWALIPQQLRGVASRSAAIELLGQRFAMPIGVSAFGAAAVLGYNADIAMAAAAYNANVPYQLSANSITPMEEVIKVNPEAWFAAYLPDDAALIRGVVERVSNAGFKTLVITVDVPVAARREPETRAGYAMPFKASARLGFDMLRHPRWVLSRFTRTLLRRGIPHIENVTPQRGPSIFASNTGSIGGAANFNWDNIRAIRAQWPGKLLLKGILSERDALTAQEIGVDGVIVSNHGARLSDSSITPLEALPNIRAACPELTVLLDGGVRRAGDALKAIALGADGVMIGRPLFYATILGGRRGLVHALHLLSAELDREMGFHGLLNVNEVREEDRLYRRGTLA
ncbi:alpha-hydroxy acid oxidase [Carnimonas nigrificans]|uniref:alpha-hydroxy acid oxidase n=1 Tax=Carnimonas nigrificans TaxID=64323 RepID=UPI0004710FDE|nr:alpha-hydroxy acid oxidase [Carnimonas nigrificans]